MQTMGFKINTPHVSAEKIDDEVMIVSLDKGDYYSLTGVAAEVWQMIADGLSENAMRERIRAAYRGDPAEMQTSLASFIDELQKEQIIVVDEQPAADQSSTTETIANDDHDLPEFSQPLLEKYTDMQMLLLIDPIHEVNDEHGWPKMKS